jgi:hypothetical protein
MSTGLIPEALINPIILNFIPAKLNVQSHQSGKEDEASNEQPKRKAKRKKLERKNASTAIPEDVPT